MSRRPLSALSRVPRAARGVAIALALLAVLAVSSSATSPAGAQDAYQPDPQLIADVRGYAAETDEGFDHVSRWFRVLQSFGALEAMTAAEAQDLADTHWAARWAPVVEELTKLEAQDGYEPDAQVAADVQGYARETQNGYDHVLRWMRVLHTFDALDDMSAAEAQGYADSGWQRWVPVAAELAALEAATAAPQPDPTATPEATPEATPAGLEGPTAQQGDNTATAPTAATANGNTLTLTFNRTVTAVLDPTNQERGADRYGTALERLSYAFSVSGAYKDGVRLGSRVPGVSMSGSTVTLSLGDLSFLPGSSGISVSYDADFAAVLGAVLQDANGDAVGSFSRSQVTNTTAGTAQPLLAAAQVAGTELTLTFDRTLDANSAPAGSRFRVVVHPDNWHAASRFISGTGTASVSGATVTVTLASAVEQGVIARVAYSKGDDPNPLRDDAAAGPEVETFSWTTATVLDRTPPQLDSTAATTAVIVLYYDEKLDTSSTPAASAFTVAKGTTAATVTAVSMTADAVVLAYTLPSPAAGTVSVSYTVPGSTPVQDAAGNAAAGFSGKPVTIANASAAPALTKAETDGSLVTLTFDGELHPAHLPAASAFTVRVPWPGTSSSWTQTITSVAVRGFKVVLDVSPGFYACAQAELDYARPAANALRNLAALPMEAAAVSEQGITNLNAHRCAHDALTEASMSASGDASGNGNRQLSMQFDRPLERRSLPDKEAFTVTPQGGAAPIAIEEVRIPDDLTRLLLTLSRPLSGGEQLTASYRPPRSAAGLRDTDGNQLAPFSAQVAAPATPESASVAALTAEFHNVPDRHDGSTPFSFGLSFSEYLERSLSHTVLRDQALVASNGAVTHVRRVTKGHNRHWTVTVQPHAAGAVTVRLAASDDCAAAPALCTPDGRALSNSPSLTVAGPPVPPAAPGELSVTTEPGLLTVNLDWDDVAGAAEYWLRWRSVDRNEQLSRGVRIVTSEVSLTLPRSGVWVARVQACNDAGCGTPGARRFTVEPAPACEQAPPEDVSALGVPRALVAFWDAPGGEDACEPTGYSIEARSLSGGPWTSETAGPLATSHVLDDLTPGRYEYRVRTNYRSRTSDPPVPEEGATGQQTNVPATCALTLTVAPYDGQAVSGRWENNTGSAGCVRGPEVEFHFKRSSDDYYRMYGRFPNWPQTDPDLPSFISNDVEPHVSYDFKIVAVDAAGQKHESNVASATIVSNDPSVTPDANSPRNLRVEASNSSGAFVSWNSPAALGPGRELTTYVVEWQTGDDPALTKSVAASSSGNHGHYITGLTDGQSYVVRVAARTIQSGDASMTTSDAWTAPAPAVTAWSEPFRVWFGAGVPSWTGGRLFLSTYTNRGAISVCTMTSDHADSPSVINCPAGTDGIEGTLVHVSDVSGAITAVVRSTQDGTGATASASSAGREDGLPPPVIRASGGGGNLHVVWTGVATNPGIGQGVGAVDAYILQHRSGTSGTWIRTEKGAGDRTHTFTGLASGTWQVRVRARDNGDDGDPNTTDKAILGFTSDVLTVTVAAGGDTPRYPDKVRVTPGDSQSLSVEWEPPVGGPDAFGYQVRWRAREGGATWTESEVLNPVLSRRQCGTSTSTCVNPRSFEITGLTGGTSYDVQVRVNNVDANGAGPWLHTLSANIAND
ncbi:MAG: SwmB domain-containing protein [Acidobacteria bacterium]|nr:SwmB domain-containing protein [Acidobacteriota bacterium]